MIISGVTLTGVTVVDAPAVTSGLVYYLDIGNPSSYSGSGTSITDISGQGLGAATLYNSPTYTSAGAGSYFTFNGSNQYVFTSNLVSKFNSPSNPATTLEMWTYVPTDNGGMVAENGSATLDGGWYDSQMEIDSGTMNVRMWNLSAVSAGTYNRSTWNQTVMTYDGTTVRSYLNAVAGATTTGTRQTPWANGFNLYYGLMAPSATNLGDGSYLAGRWSVFKVYNRALSAAEVTQNYNALRGRYGL